MRKKYPQGNTHTSADKHVSAKKPKGKLEIDNRLQKYTLKVQKLVRVHSLKGMKGLFCSIMQAYLS